MRLNNKRGLFCPVVTKKNTKWKFLTSHYQRIFGVQIVTDTNREQKKVNM